MARASLSTERTLLDREVLTPSPRLVTEKDSARSRKFSLPYTARRIVVQAEARDYISYLEKQLARSSLKLVRHVPRPAW